MWIKSQGFQINLNGSVYAHLGEECGCVGLSHKVSNQSEWMVQFILMSVRNVDVWVKLQSYKSI